ncbi:hypothetical protein AVEN_233237-1 [Araneus ventricosus]|uniref:Reelin domain-containing protein n=1 Tax=Araneus ventricosus TaxID=182803 RepID=A0A4Y2EMC0_ARAVE|nr:hypothetical protein AVEN_233237-1 [Araneus ventricosus]
MYRLLFVGWAIIVCCRGTDEVESDDRLIPQNFPGRCRRAPSGVTAPKQPGDNGFFIKISGYPEKYVPGELYTVTQRLFGERPRHFKLCRITRMIPDLVPTPTGGRFTLEVIFNAHHAHIYLRHLVEFGPIWNPKMRSYQSDIATCLNLHRVTPKHQLDKTTRIHRK